MKKKSKDNNVPTTNTNEKDLAQRAKTFNGMTAREWTINSRSVWNDLSSQRRSKHLNHGATFPEKLSDRIITMYSKENDIVLDPFLGTGTTVISAIKLKRRALGIELSEKFYNLALDEIQNFNGIFKADNFKNLHGDCINEIEK